MRKKRKNGTNKKVPKETVELILKEYKQNNFSDKKHYKNQYHRTGLSYRQLAKKYNISLSTITKIINGTY